MRSKLWLILGVAIAAVGALAAATQPWVVIFLTPGSAASEQLQASGQQLNASLSSIALAAVAAALALTIAGAVFRRVLAVLITLFGVGITAIAGSVQADPLAAARGRITEATGLSGDAIAGTVVSIDMSVFIVLTMVCGVVLGVLGLAILAFAGTWKRSGRKYTRTPVGRDRSPDEAPDRFSDWDAQNDGMDPSAGESPEPR